MKIILPFDVSGSKEINGKLTKCIIKAGEEVEIEDDELLFYNELEDKWERNRIELEEKKESEAEIRKNLIIRDFTTALRLKRQL